MASNLSDDLKRMDLKEGKNWNDLPTEIKMECIERMDFPTRWALHYTSHSEKELVETTKWDEELMAINSCSRRIVECSSSKVLFYFEHENHAAMEFVLRIRKFEVLRIDCSKPSFKNFLEIFMKFPCSAQCIILYEVRKENLEILKNCRGLLSLQIYPHDRGITLRQLLNDYEIIANTKDVYLDNILSNPIKPEDVVQLIEKWIVDDKQLGVKFNIYGYQSSSQQIVDTLKSAFGERFQVIEIGTRRLYISFKEDKYIQVDANELSGILLNVVDKLPT